MKGGTLFLFPTSAEAEGFRTLCPDAEWREIGVGPAEAGARAARFIASTGCARAVLCGIAGACDRRTAIGEAVEAVADGVAGLPAAYATTYLMNFQERYIFYKMLIDRNLFLLITIIQK